MELPQDVILKMDQQAGQIYGDQTEAFERIASELEQGVETYEDATLESMDVLDGQLENIIVTLEEAEQAANGDVPVPLIDDITGDSEEN